MQIYARLRRMWNEFIYPEYSNEFQKKNAGRTITSDRQGNIISIGKNSLDAGQQAEAKGYASEDFLIIDIIRPGIRIPTRFSIIEESTHDHT